MNLKSIRFVARSLSVLLALACLRADALEVWFMRHGETTWNRARVLQGTLDCPDLSWKGCAMAEETGRGLVDVRFDRVYSSPLLRARHTASLVTTNRDVRLDARLREIDFGDYQGVRFDPATCKDDNLRNYYEHFEKYVPRGETAETLDQVAARVRDFVERELRPLDGKCGRVLCVTHSVLLTALMQTYAAPGADVGPKGIKMRNCCVHVLDLSRGRAELKSTNRIFYDAARFDAMKPPRLVAHRGAADLAMPEASRAAYSNAVAAASDVVKLDLQRTKDGVIVLGHDRSLKRVMGWDTNVADVAYSEILAKGAFLKRGKFVGERIVRLDEALAIVRPIPEIWLDFKYFDPDFAERVFAELARAKIGPSRVMVATFRQAALAWTQSHHPEVRRVAHVSDRDCSADSIRKLQTRFALHGVNLPQKSATPELVASAKSLGLWVSLWFVQNEADARRWRDSGADAFVTDHASRVRPAFLP